MFYLENHTRCFGEQCLEIGKGTATWSDLTEDNIGTVLTALTIGSMNTIVESLYLINLLHCKLNY